MMKVRVSTGSRLHFGLLSLPPAADWPDDGEFYFGGAGLIISEPRVSVVVQESDEWSATGSLSARAFAAGKRFAAANDWSGGFAIRVEHCPPEHVGLGVGTQLELAVASAIARLLGRRESARETAAIMGRGRRSGVGTRGFAHGGFLIDEGKRRPGDISAVRRYEFPENWRLLLIIPRRADLWHGEREESAFAMIGSQTSARMRTLLELDIEPALIAKRIREFGDALTEYNALAGECFRAAQSGRYAAAFVEEVVTWLRQHGAAAAGQSSWGPTAFSIWDSEPDLRRARQMAESRWGDKIDVQQTSAANDGMSIAVL